MATYNEGIRAFPANTDLAQARRISLLASGKAGYAGADDSGEGYSIYGVKAEDSVAVRLYSSGTVEATAAGAFTVGAKVYAAAEGKVQALPAKAGSYVCIGKAIEAATADGDIVEIYPHPALLGQTETVS
ncbi:DUF2190 family protein [Desulfobaculum bizertense]|uniref:DUF2190 family protein n=1 Tax=Desulfobaculum bizertense TaxID=376490 RepID=UPI001F46BE4E|nr:DUF2190 family protein [Desulfobaculum bizertense]UIJ36884.1 DUF2190 family protein [Desulfobaculum bizertense]